MPTPPDRDAIAVAAASTVRGLQIIHLALLGGVLAFLIFTLLFRREGGGIQAAAGAAAAPAAGQVGPGPNGARDDTPVKLAFGAAAIAAIMSSIVPHVVATGGVRTAVRAVRASGAVDSAADPAADPFVPGLLAAFQTSHIVGMAILEGAAFFAILVMGGGVPPWFPAIPAGLLFVMALRFPTATHAAGWVSARREEIEAGIHG